jgi:hypothetical protein
MTKAAVGRKNTLISFLDTIGFELVKWHDDTEDRYPWGELKYGSMTAHITMTTATCKGEVMVFYGTYDQQDVPCLLFLNWKQDRGWIIDENNLGSFITGAIDLGDDRS